MTTGLNGSLSWGKTKIWDSGMLGRVGPNRGLVNCTSQSRFVHDCNAGGWLKVKSRF
jgi:hypothetical protein